MEPSELLRFVVSVLERLQLRYFVTGSTVTIFYGEPRFTNDIDIVVDLSVSAATEFCRQFPVEDFYVSEEAAINIKKMEYFREGGSEKHLRDITGVLKTSGREIDTAYIEQWAAHLGLSEIWRSILEKINR